MAKDNKLMVTQHVSEEEIQQLTEAVESKKKPSRRLTKEQRQQIEAEAKAQAAKVKKILFLVMGVIILLVVTGIVIYNVTRN